MIQYDIRSHTLSQKFRLSVLTLLTLGKGRGGAKFGPLLLSLGAPKIWYMLY